jgi:hypothetical protein
MIELVNQLVSNAERCREYMRICVVAAAVSDALTFLAAMSNEDATPLDSLYEALTATWGPHVRVLREHRDTAIDIISRAAKHVEARGEVRNGKISRDGLMLMASHLDAVRSFLDCVI